MNEGQSDALKAALEGHSFFLTGAAGTGMFVLQLKTQF